MTSVSDHKPKALAYPLRIIDQRCLQSMIQTTRLPEVLKAQQRHLMQDSSDFAVEQLLEHAHAGKPHSREHHFTG